MRVVKRQSTSLKLALDIHVAAKESERVTERTLANNREFKGAHRDRLAPRL